VLLSGDVRSNFVPARDMQSMSLADLDRNIHLCWIRLCQHCVGRLWLGHGNLCKIFKFLHPLSNLFCDLSFLEEPKYFLPLSNVVMWVLESLNPWNWVSWALWTRGLHHPHSCCSPKQNPKQRAILMELFKSGISGSYKIFLSRSSPIWCT
jgi:hypothetical protein